MTDFLATLTLLEPQTIPVLVPVPVTKIALTINAPVVAAKLATTADFTAALAPVYTMIAVPSNISNMAIVSVVSLRGAQGVAGPPGPVGGPGGKNLTFTQNIPSEYWAVNHNFGYHPSVTTIDPSGKIIEGDVTYLDLDNLEIYFSEPLIGSAYLI